MPRLPQSIALSLAIASAFTALAEPASAQHVRRLAEKSQSAVVALDHRVGMRGGFNRQRNTGENLFDGQARTTGFVISREGHVVTHARFVQGRDRIRLYFHGGAKGWAKVLGIDPINRTALLKLEKPEKIAARFNGTLPSLEWGDSTGLAAGNTVFSLGNCFDSLRLDGQASFSQGVITTVERARLGAYRGPLITTDASVNPGSFGGPLLNAKGQVVGVIARNISTRRWLGAAIPAEQVRRGIDRLMAGRPLAKGLLGVALERTGGETALKGLKLTRVQRESGAAKAGLAVGDFLLAIDGNRVYDTNDVARELGNLPSGAVVNARVRSGGKTRTIRIVLGDGADMAALAARPKPKPTPEATPRPKPVAKAKVSLGLRVQERETGPGLEVIEVRPGGTAAAAGVEKGDILAALGRDRIRSSDDLARALTKYRKGQRAQLVVIRERRARRLLLNFGGPSAVKPAPIRPAPRPARASLGVRVQERADGSPGLEVIGVRPNTAAADGGVRVGDVILRWNQFQIRTMDDLGRALAQLKDAGPTRMRVLRSGRQLGLRLPAIGKPLATKPTPTPSTGKPRLGLRLEVQEGARGPVVTEVAPGSLAAKAGFLKGDVLVAMGRKRLSSLEDVAAILRATRPGASLTAVVIRNSRARRISFVWGAAGGPLPKPPSSSAPGYLGVYLPDDQGQGPGVLIEGSVVGSPADKAGLRSGDRIVSVNGRSVGSRQQLGQALRGKRAGETVALMIVRGRKTMGLSIVLGERGKTAPAQPQPTQPKPAPSGGPWLGAAIQDGPDGITIAEVAKGGPFYAAGLRAKDVLKSINGKRLTTVDQFASIFARLRPGQTVTFEVERDGWSKSVRVRLARRP
jgi:serine protease Do